MSVSLMAIAGAVIVTTYCRVEIGLLNTNMMIPGSTGKTNLDEFAASFYSTFFESATCVEGCPRYFFMNNINAKSFIEAHFERAPQRRFTQFCVNDLCDLLYLLPSRHLSFVTRTIMDRLCWRYLLYHSQIYVTRNYHGDIIHEMFHIFALNKFCINNFLVRIIRKI